MAASTWPFRSATGPPDRSRPASPRSARRASPRRRAEARARRRQGLRRLVAFILRSLRPVRPGAGPRAYGREALPAPSGWRSRSESPPGCIGRALTSGSMQSGLSTRWRSSRTSTNGPRRSLSASQKARHHHARHAASWRGEGREDLFADRLDRRPGGMRSRRAAARDRCGARRASATPMGGCPARSSPRGSSTSRSRLARPAGASAYRRYRPASRSGGHGEPGQGARAPLAGQDGAATQRECWFAGTYRRPGLVNLPGRRCSGRGAGSIVAQTRRASSFPRWKRPPRPTRRRYWRSRRAPSA